MQDAKKKVVKKAGAVPKAGAAQKTGTAKTGTATKTKAGATKSAKPAAKKAAVTAVGGAKLANTVVGKPVARRAPNPYIAPEGVPLLLKVAFVTAGQDHTVLLSTEGEVFTWGAGAFGCLGHGDEEDAFTPRKLESLTSMRIVLAAAGTEHTLLVNDGGELLTFGKGEEGPLGHGDEEDCFGPKRVSAIKYSEEGKRVVAVAAGEQYSMAATADGTLYTFGYGECGRLGHGDEETVTKPKAVKALAKAGQKVVAVAASAEHSLCVTADGGAFAFGSYGYGQLGMEDEDEEEQLLPQRVQCEGLAKEKVVGCAAGKEHSLLLTKSGRVFGFGCGQHGRLGTGGQDDSYGPTPLPSLHGTTAAAIAAGDEHSVVVLTDGQLVTFGNGTSGCLGHGDPLWTICMGPRAVGALGKAHCVGAACGAANTFAVTDNGDLFAMGDATSGALGLGTNENQLLPLPVCATEVKARYMEGVSGGKKK